MSLPSFSNRRESKTLPDVVRATAALQPVAAQSRDLALKPVVSSGPSEDETRVARQKALFVEQSWAISASDHIQIKDACAIAALQTEQFPDLVSAGKHGASLIAPPHGYHNYRSWARQLGRITGSRKPDSANWVALVPSHKGSREYVRPGNPRFWDMLRKLYEHPNCLSLRYAYDLAVKAAAGLIPDSELPSYTQCHWYYDRHADQKVVMIARKGEEWYRNNICSYITRKAPAVDECWFSDHHIFDAAVRVWDEKKSEWRAVRPWITAWLDWGSLYFVGFVIRTISPNRDSIERSLRLAITRNNFLPPIHIYIDNGKDYKASGFARMNDLDVDRIKSVCGLLGCQTHFAIPYNARAKVIERVFRIVCEQFSKLWHSYRGSTPAQRPENADEAWRHPETLPTLDQFTGAFESWLCTMYHARHSCGRILNGKSPSDARMNPRCSRPALDAQSVYKAFLREIPGGARKVMRGGMIRAINRFYQADFLWTLFDRKTEVRVKVDPDDLSTAWIYTIDGRELGPAKSAPQLPALITEETPPETIEQLRSQIKRQRTEIAYARNALPGTTPTLGAAAFLPPNSESDPHQEEPARHIRRTQPDVSADQDLVDALDAAIREETEANLTEIRQVDDLLK